MHRVSKAVAKAGLLACAALTLVLGFRRFSLTRLSDAIVPAVTSFPKLNCPQLRTSRYDYLRSTSHDLANGTSQVKYFFALDLHQCVEVIPQLLGSVGLAMRFLGPQNCAVSIVEGRSTDGSSELLNQIGEDFQRLGASYFFASSSIDPYATPNDAGGGGRIQALAELRNLALAPLVDHPEQYDPGATVIFLNDVAICTEDILELVHQRQYQNADMTCAMDWTYVGHDPTFYDLWVARGMNGDSFFEVPEDGSWDSAWKIFWNNPPALSRFMAGQPFQVFSCWNGAAAFTAKPLLEKKIAFRSSRHGECQQGEPQLFCKDLWYNGYGKIAVVPSINLEYSIAAGARIKEAKGYASSWIEREGNEPIKVDWQTSPPPLVKCMPLYANQTWVPWDEGMADHRPNS